MTVVTVPSAALALPGPYLVGEVFSLQSMLTSLDLIRLLDDESNAAVEDEHGCEAQPYR